MNDQPAISASDSGYELGEVLGQGGFGVVYRATARGVAIAVKKLQRLSPHALYRFKTEFRAMADIAHPNLVRLHELRKVGEDWYLAMELVEGQDLTRYVRPGGGVIATPTTFSTDALDDLSPTPPRPPPSAAFDEPRLRAAFAQVARGIDALHSRGLLHRDLKPSNVLVTPEGRAVVLDFGLAIELDRGKQTGVVAGTPDYISPEHAEGRPIGEPSDWYSFGVMLYEALTGRVPFSGPALQVVRQKAFMRAPDPREDLPQIPADLAVLALRLLEPDPAKRPSAAEILAVFSAGAAPRHREQAPLLGRDAELRALEEALDAVRQEERPGVVWVIGESGMGKTALIRHFMERVAMDPETLALPGRCYEREALPHKGLDSLIDRLARWLSAGNRASVLQPRHAGALARLFPVLGALDNGAWTHASGNVQDPFERRRRAAASLRDLLGRVTERWRVVLSLDDVQWSDADGAELLSELLMPPDAPPVLWLLTCRAADLDRSPMRQRLAAVPGLAARDLRPGALPEEEAIRLARVLLGERGGEAPRIARESGGNPYFIEQLARMAGAGTSAPDTTLDALIRERVVALPPPARALLRAVAVAGRPIPSRVAAGVVDVNPGEGIEPLLAARLVRLGADTTEERIETWHDRIRESVVAAEDPAALRELHLRLARALDEGGDAEAIAEHYRGAGLREEAARRFAKAGEEAASVLAFDRAARLWGMALSLGGDMWGEARPGLLARQAEALYIVGRLGEAAGRFREAASLSSGSFALEMRHRAAMSLLQGGFVVEGTALIREVLGAVGLRLPDRPQDALLPLLWRRFLIFLGGNRFQELPPEAQSEALRFRADVCWSVAAGLVFVDSVRAVLFQSEMQVVARKLGDPLRYTRALLFDIGFGATGGGRVREKMRRRIERARAFVEKLDNPEIEAAFRLNTGVVHLFRGEWAEALALYAGALEIYRTRCTGVSWEKDTGTLFSLRCLFYLGRLDEMVRLTEEAVREAADRGDNYLLSYASLRNTPYCAIIRDQAEGLPEELDRRIASMNLGGFYYQHLQCLCTTVDAELYLGHGERAMERVEAAWPKLDGSLMLRNQYSFIETWFLRGRATLAGGGDPRPCIRKLRGEGMPWSEAAALLLEGGLAARQGAAEAPAKLLGAAEAFERIGMRLYAASARHRRARLLGDSEALGALEEALRQLGVVAPEKLVRLGV